MDTQIGYLDISRASQLIADGAYSEAGSLLEQLFRQAPQNLDVVRGLGESYFGIGDIKGAKHYTGIALQLAPKDPQTLNNAGVILHQLKDYAKAEQMFELAIANRPDFVDAHLNLCAVWGNITLDDPENVMNTNRLVRSITWISDFDPDPTRNEMLQENMSLRQSLLNDYHGCRSGSQQRVLLHCPTTGMGALKYVMESWCDILNFMGIESRLLQLHDSFADVLNSFDPTTLITIDCPALTEQLDSSVLRKYRTTHRLTVGLCIGVDEQRPPADFYITFHLAPDRDPVLSRISEPLISLPFGFNPLIHYMRPGRTLWDFAFVGSNSVLKEQETLAYLIPIIQNYSGILAGTSWPGKFGNISQADAGLLYNFAAICPNYHLNAQIQEYNEVNERTFVILACGGFQIVDRPKAMRDLFDDDELVVASSPAEYHDLFAHYLTRSDERSVIARRGMRKVWERYSLFNIVAKLADFLGIPKTDSIDSMQLTSGKSVKNAP